MRLKDILESIERIEKYTKGRTEANFLEDYVLSDAVVRRLEIIGEAAKHIPESVREQYDEIPWRLISGLRDVAIHDYADLLIERIWKTVKRDLPKLKENIKTVLKDLEKLENSQ